LEDLKCFDLDFCDSKVLEPLLSYKSKVQVRKRHE